MLFLMGVNDKMSRKSNLNLQLLDSYSNSKDSLLSTRVNLKISNVLTEVFEYLCLIIYFNTFLNLILNSVKKTETLIESTISK